MNATNNASSFVRLAAINVNEHVEKKQGLSSCPGPGPWTNCSAPIPPQHGNTGTAAERRT